MSPAFNGSSALERFECGNASKIRNEIICSISTRDYHILHNIVYMYRGVPQIHPPFCNLSLSTKRGGGGACTRDATISLAITPSLLGMKSLSVGGGGQVQGVAELEAERCSRR